MKKSCQLILLIMLVALVSCSVKRENYLKHVDPNIGTAHSRWFFYTPAAVPYGMAKLAPSTNGHYEVLEQEHAVVATLSKEEISATSATERIAKKLNVNVGSPILVRKRFVYDQQDQAIEYNIGYYKADSFIYTLESTR